MSIWVIVGMLGSLSSELLAFVSKVSNGFSSRVLVVTLVVFVLSDNGAPARRMLLAAIRSEASLKAIKAIWPGDVGVAVGAAASLKKFVFVLEFSFGLETNGSSSEAIRKLNSAER